MRRFLPLLILAAFVAPSTASAQGFALAAHAGTAGVGGSAIIGVSPKLNLRGSLGYVPGEHSVEVNAISWSMEFPTFMRALVDFFPTGGAFHLTGGGLWVSKGGNFDVVGTFVNDFQFGNNTYAAADVGELHGTFNMKKFQPYLGIGFGNAVSRSIGLNVDLGVGFGETPTVDLFATGPIANVQAFRDDLDAEILDIQNDIPEYLKYYPVFAISLSIGFGK